MSFFQKLRLFRALVNQRSGGAWAGRYAALRRFRVARFDIARMQRAMVERNGRIAMRYAPRTMNPKPNIARMAVKLGDFSSTKTAGSSVIKARIFVRSNRASPPPQVPT